jgi:hypothetical protein
MEVRGEVRAVRVPEAISGSIIECHVVLGDEAVEQLIQ